MSYLGVYLGLIVLYPEYLCSSPACKCGIGCDINKLFSADDAVHLLNLGSCSLVAPDYRLTENIVVLVQHNETVHLSRDTDTLYVLLLNTALSHNSLYGLDHCVCPVRRILLRIAVLGLIHGIFDSL